MNATIEIKETKVLTVAAINHTGVAGIEYVFDRLIQWANSKSIYHQPNTKLGRIFYDSFKVTAPNKIQMCIFLTSSITFEPEKEIKKLTIDTGRCIIGRFEIAPYDFEKAWNSLFIWMNENEYKKSSKNPYEIYHNDFRQHPEQKFIVDLHIPIK